MKLVSRRRARERAVQAVYSWQISKNLISDIRYEFIEDANMLGVDTNYFCDLLFGVVNNIIKLDDLITSYSYRKINELGQIEKAILRISMYELTYREDISYKIIINEGIELAKIFGAEHSYKFINGVLDKTTSAYRKKIKI
ncbi:N utilization substance protein B [Candidatus Providencia siddallii]|uniref:Transcription antitermination protein NusB n=1 Tax=Candidatus Providencia siddallii TaxID=1715285 RepID=A0A0M6W6R6_9GAMM|nr:N utilization substance protein B [Candidatus Providencia siddallii]